MLDAALLHEVIGGHDPLDSTSIDAPVPPRRRGRAARPTSAGMRIGVVKELGGEGYQAGRAGPVRRGGAAAGRGRAPRSSRCRCPHFDYALAAYYLILPSEASSNLAKFDAMRYGLRVLPDGVDAPTRRAGHGGHPRRRASATRSSAGSSSAPTPCPVGYYDAYYGQAQKVRTLIARDFAAAFEQADVLVSPTAPTTAFPLGEKLDDPLAMYLNDVATIPANLAGVPGMSLPSGLADEDGLPAGIQLLAPARADDRLYRAGAALEALLLQRWGGPLLGRVPALSGS